MDSGHSGESSDHLPGPTRPFRPRYLHVLGRIASGGVPAATAPRSSPSSRSPRLPPGGSPPRTNHGLRAGDLGWMDAHRLIDPSRMLAAGPPAGGSFSCARRDLSDCGGFRLSDPGGKAPFRAALGRPGRAVAWRRRRNGHRPGHPQPACRSGPSTLARDSGCRRAWLSCLRYIEERPDQPPDHMSAHKNVLPPP